MHWDKKTYSKSLALVVVLISFSFIVANPTVVRLSPTGNVVNAQGDQYCNPFSGSVLVNDFEGTVSNIDLSNDPGKTFFSSATDFKKTGSKSGKFLYNPGNTWEDVFVNFPSYGKRYLEFWIMADQSNPTNTFPQFKIGSYERNDYVTSPQKGVWYHAYIDLSQYSAQYYNNVDIYYYDTWFGNGNSASFYLDDIRLTDTLSNCGAQPTSSISITQIAGRTTPLVESNIPRSSLALSGEYYTIPFVLNVQNVPSGGTYEIRSTPNSDGSEFNSRPFGSETTLNLPIFNNYLTSTHSLGFYARILNAQEQEVARTSTYNLQITVDISCTSTSWTPSDTSRVCPSSTVTQTSNCGTQRQVAGTKTCPSGQTCSNNQCTTTQTCSDSDGNNINTAGSVAITTGTGAVTVNYDTCINGQVREWTCIGNQASSDTRDCPSGQRCSNGACVAQSDSIGSKVSNAITTEPNYLSFQATITPSTLDSVWQAIVEQGSNSEIGWHFYQNGKKLYINFDNAQNNYYTSDVIQIVNTNYIVNFTKIGNTVNIYVNGQLIVTKTISPMHLVGDGVYIGIRKQGSQYQYQGTISGARLVIGTNAIECSDSRTSLQVCGTKCSGTVNDNCGNPRTCDSSMCSNTQTCSNNVCVTSQTQSFPNNDDPNTYSGTTCEGLTDSWWYYGIVDDAFANNDPRILCHNTKYYSPGRDWHEQGNGPETYNVIDCVQKGNYYSLNGRWNLGTKPASCGGTQTCTLTSWTPSDTSTLCPSNTVTQTSNCGTLRNIAGTKTCPSGQTCSNGNCIISDTFTNPTVYGYSIAFEQNYFPSYSSNERTAEEFCKMKGYENSASFKGGLNCQNPVYYYIPYNNWPTSSETKCMSQIVCQKTSTENICTDSRTDSQICGTRCSDIVNDNCGMPRSCPSCAPILTSEAGFCGDHLDNDNNGKCDYDGLNCPNSMTGDQACPVYVTNVAVSNSAPTVNTAITVSCTVNVGGLQSIGAKIFGQSSNCPFVSWSSNVAQFTCTPTNTGSKTVQCFVDTTKAASQSSGQIVSATINVVNACIPTTCSVQRKNCGSISDSCSGTLNCGTCANTQKCTNNVCVSSSTYSWHTASWGTCSVSCGSGTQSRIVTCQRNDDVAVADSFCTGTKPSASQDCNTQDCSVANCWTPDPSTKCGEFSQTKLRTSECFTYPYSRFVQGTKTCTSNQMCSGTGNCIDKVLTIENPKLNNKLVLATDYYSASPEGSDMDTTIANLCITNADPQYTYYHGKMLTEIICSGEVYDDYAFSQRLVNVGVSGGRCVGKVVCSNDPVSDSIICNTACEGSNCICPPDCPLSGRTINHGQTCGQILTSCTQVCTTDLCKCSSSGCAFSGRNIVYGSKCTQ